MGVMLDVQKYFHSAFREHELEGTRWPQIMTFQTPKNACVQLLANDPILRSWQNP